ncbi:SpoIIE family protein phosphatase [Streptomyces sp. NPDC019990]|uniref:PP2C family protein-serine/threonine phosphatase n=1 Tax=Streptomyces sp. NPDC019990 TaxID=3154693 RepID=UPI0033D23270
MPSHLSADRPAAQPPGRGSVDALITQTRRLKGDVDAVRRDTEEEEADHPQGRWQRALYDLALHQLDDLDEHLAQLRDGPLPRTAAQEPAAPPRGSLLSRVGSAEWNLLTDEASWSMELYGILGRDPAAAPLTLDELPSIVLDEDRPKLTAMVTDCLVDARPIDGEFRVAHRDGDVRTVHMLGEPVLGADGSTASMWAVLRDVSTLRRSQRVVSETRDSLHDQWQAARTGHRLAVEPREVVQPPWRGPLRLPHSGPRALDVAARHVPASTTTLIGGDWHDALEVTDGETLLGAGDLTGHGVGVTSQVSMVLGAVRGMAMAGARPSQLMTLLDQLLRTTARPVLGNAVCCRYRPATRTLTWALAGHPAPLLFRGGTGRALTAPDGALLGTASGSVYGQAEETLEAGDLLVLHTNGLVPGQSGTVAADLILDLAPRLTGTVTAQDCLRAVVQRFGEGEREDSACVLVAKVMS